MTTQTICSVSDLVENSGVCALINDNGISRQVAVFYLPGTQEKVFALGNWDPIGEANVMSRGIVGNIGDDLVVASPLYKQHFSLRTGNCLEEDACLPTYSVKIEGDSVVLAA